MEIIINNCLRIPRAYLPPGVAEELMARFTFPNPAYKEAVGRMKAMGLKGYPRLPKEIQGWAIYGSLLVVPRGCTADVLDFLKERQVAYKLINQTRALAKVDFTFKGHLKDAQVPAVEATLARRFGTIESPTGSGKTVMGLYIIAKRRQPALVVVHTVTLMNQWVERAGTFLGLPREEIGIIGQGQQTVGKRLTVALVQTLRKCAKEIAPKIGHVICDEVHHAPATTFTEALAPFDSAYALGLSATHKRRDGLTPLIYWHIGPKTYEVSRGILVRDGDIIQVEPVIRETDFVPSEGYDPAWQRAALMKELCENEMRNAGILADLILESKNGPCIVLTDRKAHADTLAAMAVETGLSAESCHGGLPKSQQEAVIKALNESRLQVLVATGQLLGEGFDCKKLTALFLATPIKFSGRLIQYLGRVARSAEGKVSARVYDYHDIHVDVLMKAARERLRTYKKLSRQEQAPTPKRRKV